MRMLLVLYGATAALTFAAGVVYSNVTKGSERVSVTRFCTDVVELDQAIEANRRGHKGDYLALVTSGNCRDTNQVKAPAYAAYYLGEFEAAIGGGVYTVGVYRDIHYAHVLMFTWQASDADARDVATTYEDYYSEIQSLLAE